MFNCSLLRQNQHIKKFITDFLSMKTENENNIFASVF